MYCDNCGKEHPDTAMFCDNCGRDLSAEGNGEYAGDDQYGGQSQQGHGGNQSREGGYEQGRGRQGDSRQSGGGPGGHGDAGYSEGGYNEGGYNEGGYNEGGYGHQPGLETDILGKRIVAYIVDSLLLTVLFAVVIAVTGFSMLGLVAETPSGSAGAAGAAGGAIALLAFLVGIAGFLFYILLLEGYWNGQTVGKRVMNIRVVNADGSEIGYSESLVRNLIKLVLSIFGILWVILTIILIAVTDRNQRIGDMAAGTVVVNDRSPRPPQGQQRPSQGPQGRGDQYGQQGDQYGQQQGDQYGQQQGDQYGQQPRQGEQSRQGDDRSYGSGDQRR